MSANIKPPKQTVISRVIDTVLRALGLRRNKKKGAKQQGSSGASTPVQSQLSPFVEEEQVEGPVKPVSVVFRDLQGKYQQSTQNPNSAIRATQTKADTDEELIADISAYRVLFPLMQTELNIWSRKPSVAFNIPKEQTLEKFQSALKSKKAFDETKTKKSTDWHRIYWEPKTNDIFIYVEPVKDYHTRSTTKGEKISFTSLKSPAEKIQHVLRCCFHSWRMSVALDKPEAAAAANSFINGVKDMEPSYVKYAFLKCMIEYLENLKGINMVGLVAGSQAIQATHAERGADKETRAQLKSSVATADFVKKGLSAPKNAEFQKLLNAKIADLQKALEETRVALYEPKKYESKKNFKA